MQSILLDYIQAGTTAQFKTEKPFWIPLVGFIGISIGLSEIIIYFYIFYYLYKYNETSQLLPEETKKSRHRFNAQTMVGQFYFYITDTVYLLFILITFMPSINAVAPETKDIISLVKTAEFGLMSVLQMLLIPALRKDLFKHVQNQFTFLKRKLH